MRCGNIHSHIHTAVSMQSSLDCIGIKMHHGDGCALEAIFKRMMENNRVYSNENSSSLATAIVHRDSFKRGARTDSETVKHT